METTAIRPLKRSFLAINRETSISGRLPDHHPFTLWTVHSVTGFDTDALSRKYLSERQYKDYPHGLGHQVGIYVHDGGVSLSRRDSGRGPLRCGNVFAVEPATYIEAGYLCVEEMVHITADGPVFITEPQKELYLVR